MLTDLNTVFNMRNMEAPETASLIAAAGGDAAFARLLGIDHKPGIAQRVNNWKRRGIPSEVLVDHYDTIRELRRLLDKTESA